MTASATYAAAPSLALERHSLPQTIALHLLPGVAITLVFALLAGPITQAGLPATLALLLTWPAAGVPIELGFLLYLGWRRNGRPSLAGVVLNRQPMPLRHYAWLVPVLLVWSAVVSTMLFPIAEVLRRGLFAWWPEALGLSGFAQSLSQYPPAILWTVVLLSAITNILVPVAEEGYFRGYLLPRIPASRQWAPLVNAMLFSLYHFWLPWDFLGRVVTLLPVVYAVQWKRNLHISVLVHVLLNSLGTLGLLALVLGAVRPG